MADISSRAEAACRRVVVAVLGLFLLLPVPAAALDRVFRLFDQQHGLPTDDVADVAQDAQGFLWIATPGGLVRFDGDEVRLWEGSSRAITMIRAAPDGEIVAVDDRARLLRVDATRVVEFAGPDGAMIDNVLDVRWDAFNVLWIVRTDEVLRYGRDAVWQRLSRERFGGELPRRISVDDRTGVFVLTNDAIWHVSPNDEVRREVAVASPLDVLRQPDGTLMVLASSVFIVRPNGELDPVLEFAARPVDFLVRAGTVWVSLDRYVARLAPGEPPTFIGPEHGLPGGGRLLVDREGSLWICSFRGLLQFPEPETVVWTERDGLPSTHARFLGRNDEGLWASTWAGLARIVPENAGRVWPASPLHQGDICIDGAGGLWYGGDYLHERRAGAITVHRFANGILRFCARSHDGSVWLGIGRALVRGASGGPIRVPAPLPVPSGAALPAPLLEDDAGRLWVAYGGQICRAEVTRILNPAEWTCEPLPEGVEPRAMLQRTGGLWLATAADGVFRRQNDAWQQIPASRALGGGRVFKLRSGTDETVWVLGLGRPTRVIDRPDTPLGWEVVEVLSSWHGLPSGGTSDLLEEEDGTIWTASAAGVARVPAHARQTPRTAPRVELSSVFVDGRAVGPEESLDLVHRSNLTELRFAALTYRDRSLLRYQVRLGDGSPWMTLAGGDPVFRFAELPAGSYVAEFRASLDGRTWSPRSRRLAFEVRNPWYLQAWFLAVAVAGVGLLLLGVHGARVRLVLRLERQRTQVAMDLHDEIGSGLGSIGILAGIADTRTSDPRNRAILGDIGATAAELSTSLGDIVWSLRAQSRTLGNLVERLAERGHRLFSEDDQQFVCQMPDLHEPVWLDLAVQRNVLLIAMEALHNAASHAGARRVELHVSPEGACWRLRVLDDGRGFAVEDKGSASGGLGLSSMRRRAAEIGADLDVRSTPGSGTSVSLLFDPRGAPVRQWWPFRRRCANGRRDLHGK